MGNESSGAISALVGPVNRRGFLGRCAAVPVAGIASGGIATSALAATRLNTYKGKYAIDGHRVVDGYFASPRGKTALDMVIVIPATGALDGAAEATARDYAARGWMAIAPNLSTTYRGAALLGKSAMVSALMSDMPRLKRFGRGNGKVMIVAA